MNRTDNCISHWFPKIQDAGLPVPRTILVKTDVDLAQLLDGEKPKGLNPFMAELRQAVLEIGAPCFLRTGQGSGKDQWKETCYLTNPDRLPKHVMVLLKWSAQVDFFGLPTDVWAVRELLPTQPVAKAFHGMPVCREFRCFVQDGQLICLHPYWPKDAIEVRFRKKPNNWDEVYHHLCKLSKKDRQQVTQLACSAGKAVGGAWSVDILDTSRGWFVTDMDPAAQSRHWPGCRHEEKFNPRMDPDCWWHTKQEGDALFLRFRIGKSPVPPAVRIRRLLKFAERSLQFEELGLQPDVFF